MILTAIYYFPGQNRRRVADYNNMSLLLDRFATREDDIKMSEQITKDHSEPNKWNAELGNRMTILHCQLHNFFIQPQVSAKNKKKLVLLL